MIFPMELIQQLVKCMGLNHAFDFQGNMRMKRKSAELMENPYMPLIKTTLKGQKILKALT